MDVAYKFIWLSVSSYRNPSSSDGQILNNSEPRPVLEEGTLGLPSPCPLQKCWDFLHVLFSSPPSCFRSSTRYTICKGHRVSTASSDPPQAWHVPSFGDSQLISPRTKWPSFCGRYFQMHFREWMFFIWNKISPKFALKGPIDNKPVLV